MADKTKEIKYLSIKNNILQMIGEGQYKPGDKLPTEHMLARANSVSIITSKKALDELERENYIYRIKGSGSFVAEHVPGSGSDHPKIIALVLPLGSNTESGLDFFSSIEMVAKQSGYYVSIENTGFDYQTERKIIRRLLDDNIRGIIYYPSFTSENFELIKLLSMRKYPLVIIDKYIHDVEIDTVQCDNYNASKEMTRYLIQNGHKNIAFLSINCIDEISSVRDRFLGYCDALSASGLSLDIDLVFYPERKYSRKMSPENRQAFYNQVLDALLTDNQVTAIQAASDHDAANLIRELDKRHISVPDRISVVGFDNLDIASYTSPALTTMKQDFRLIGQKAAELLFSRLENPDRPCEKLLIHCDLIIRESVKLKCRKNLTE